MKADDADCADFFLYRLRQCRHPRTGTFVPGYETADSKILRYFHGSSCLRVFVVNQAVVDPVRYVAVESKTMMAGTTLTTTAVSS
jgi:hypothetical protein